MGDYYISSPRVVPEIWRREGFFSKKWVEIGSGCGSGWPGNFIDGVYYLITSYRQDLFSNEPSPCSYCGNKTYYYIKKYKSDTYHMKRRPPTKAQDLSIIDKVVVIIPYFYTKCSKCSGEYGPEEREFVLGRLKFEIGVISERYDDKSLSKMSKELQNLNLWNIENILIRKEDILYSST